MCSPLSLTHPHSLTLSLSLSLSLCNTLSQAIAQLAVSLWCHCLLVVCLAKSFWLLFKVFKFGVKIFHVLDVVVVAVVVVVVALPIGIYRASSGFWPIVVGKPFVKALQQPANYCACIALAVQVQSIASERDRYMCELERDAATYIFFN